jgi:hypothetical protein
MRVREAVLDVILFSSAPNLRKLWLILVNGSRGKNLDFEEWLGILCFMMGVDQKEYIRKRLENILRHRKVKLNGRF